MEKINKQLYLTITNYLKTFILNLNTTIIYFQLKIIFNR